MQLFRATVPALVLSALAFASPSQATGSPLYPKRLVLSLDGVAWATVHELQTRSEKPCFSRFRPVGKMVSTYPSLSDIAWADLLRTPPPLGYQRYHYSIGKNAIVGGSLSDLGNPIDYEKRMHVAFTQQVDHLKTYLSPAKMGKLELDEVFEEFRKAGALRDFHAYLLSTDSMQHTYGDIRALLCWMSDEIDGLVDEVKRESGQDLQVLIVSDHGHNQRTGGKMIDLRRNLRKAGFNVRPRIDGENDVVFTTGGILTSVSVFARPTALARISEVALSTEGVDLVTRVENADSILIEGGKGGRARVVYDRSSDRFAYQPIDGDPLDYIPVIENFTGEKFPGRPFGGETIFLSAQEWIDASADAWYPVAPERIWRGHHVITLNPSPLIISLKDGYEMTYGIVKAMSKLKKRGGTHGNLSAPASLGVTLANYTDTPTLSTRQVSTFYDLTRFYNWQDHERGGQFAGDVNFGDRDFPADIFNEVATPWSLHSSHEGSTPLWINLWDPDVADWKSLGLETSFAVTITPIGKILSTAGEKKPRPIEREIWARDLPSTSDGAEFRIPIAPLLEGTDFGPGQYRVKVRQKKVDPVSGETLLERTLFKDRFIIDLDGQVIVW